MPVGCWRQRPDPSSCRPRVNRARAQILEEEPPEPGPVERSSSFGTMAEIAYAADTMFLTEFPGGWKVMAAGCAPVPGHPYDCRLQGG